MAGGDDFADGGGGLGVDGLGGDGAGDADRDGADVQSNTATSGADGKPVKKRMDLEAALQMRVAAGSDFVAPKEPDGKSAI